MIKKIASAAVLTLAATSAFADNKVGLFFVPSADIDVSADVGSGDDDGDGFGVYGKFDVSPTSFFELEYSAVEYDDTELEIDQIRVGYGGHIQLANPQLAVKLLAEIINLELALDDEGSEDDTGFGLHAGINFAASPQFDLRAQIGYLKIDNADGPEVKFGVDYKASEQFSLFADYRATRFEDDGADLDLDDIRLGAALHF